MTALWPPQLKRTYWLSQHACPLNAATFTSPHGLQHPINTSICFSPCTEVTPCTTARTSYNSYYQSVHIATQNRPTMFPTIQPSSTSMANRHDCSPASTAEANARTEAIRVSAQSSHFQFAPCHTTPYPCQHMLRPMHRSHAVYADSQVV